MPAPVNPVFVYPSGNDKGLELRDFFAAAALQGMLTSGTIPSQLTSQAVDAKPADFNWAAWKMADLMISNRGH